MYYSKEDCMTTLNLIEAELREFKEGDSDHKIMILSLIGTLREQVATL